MKACGENSSDHGFKLGELLACGLAIGFVGGVEVGHQAVHAQG